MPKKEQKVVKKNKHT